MSTMSGIAPFNNYPIEKFRIAEGPVIDVRSPKEFNQGHIPGALNLPLFTDKEREIVGLTYKKKGKEEAILLGLRITIPKLHKLSASIKNINNKKSNYLNSKDSFFLKFYCWRGGMRSSSIAWLAKRSGFQVSRLDGGYKSYRKWVLNQFQKQWHLRVLGGRTGTGKTDLLQSISNQGISIIDLEGLANHRGSSFGGLGLPPQPSTQNYENLLAESLDLCERNMPLGIWIEDESPNLGKCRIPNELFEQIKVAPIIEITRSKKERIKQLVKVYSKHSKVELKESTMRISRRLGPLRTAQAIKAIEDSNWEFACEAMLDYYDKCYDYQLNRNPDRKTIDISGLNNKSAAKKLLEEVARIERIFPH